VEIFGGSLRELRESRLCTAELRHQLERTTAAWQAFRAAIDRDQVDEAIPLNEALLAETQKTVVLFEAISGSVG